MIWNLIARLAAMPRVANWLIEYALGHPYTHIRDPQSGNIYMGRWWLFNPYPAPEEQRGKNRFPISIRIHWIRRPDTDRNLHDHPWNARTIILKGGYIETRLVGDKLVQFNRKPGDTAKINFGEYHKIDAIAENGAWTIFITGKYRGTWGFLVNGVKVQWRKYLGVNQ